MKSHERHIEEHHKESNVCVPVAPLTHYALERRDGECNKAQRRAVSDSVAGVFASSVRSKPSNAVAVNLSLSFCRFTCLSACLSAIILQMVVGIFIVEASIKLAAMGFSYFRHLNNIVDLLWAGLVWKSGFDKERFVASSFCRFSLCNADPSHIPFAPRVIGRQTNLAEQCKYFIFVQSF